MPVALDPDTDAVYKVFQDAGLLACETLTVPEARDDQDLG
ncbi:hypothetical protein ACVWXO_007801 [Bradyrhizobium sp. LM2.7]